MLPSYLPLRQHLLSNTRSDLVFLRLGAVNMSRLSSWRAIALVSFFLGTWLVLPVSAQKWNKYGPGTRSQASAIYDSSTNTMIVFGGTDCAGNFYSDLWILSNADGTTGTPNWTLAAPLGVGPSARSQATAVYDSTNNVMTVFAGGTVSTTAFNDVFTLSNAN